MDSAETNGAFALLPCPRKRYRIHDFQPNMGCSSRRTQSRCSRASDSLHFSGTHMVRILRTVAATFAALLSCVSLAHAQTPLSVGQPVAREIAPGSSQSYAIDLDAGEYVAGVVDQRGITVSLRVSQPDGSPLRDFPGPPQGKRLFAFIAETAGTYRFELTAPPIADAARSGVQPTGPGRFELSITENVSLDDRLKPTASQPSSPTIKALRAQVARGDKSTEAFWQLIAEKGTPLVEPLEGNPRYTLVTFLWRGLP